MGGAGAGAAKLKGRIVEMGLTQEKVAQEMGISKTTLNLKINGTDGADFSRGEIVMLCDILDIEAEQITDYFFVA
jgi:transcriptional regulator with XRE-family HTH domain